MIQKKTAILGKVFLIFGVLLAVAIPTARAQAILYDDFSGPLLDENKWTATLVGPGVLDSVRRIARGKLILLHRGLGRVIGDNGQTHSTNRLNFLQNTDFRSISFRVRVMEVDAEGCDTPGSALSEGRLGVFGRFFNDGSGSSNNRTGDVNAILDALHDSTDTASLLRVVGRVLRCTNAGCSSLEEIGTANLGTMPTGVNTRLLMRWDPDNDRFVFRKNAEDPQFVGYTVSAENERTGRNISVSTDAANCTTGPRPFAKISAAIYNIDITDAD